MAQYQMTQPDAIGRVLRDPALRESLAASLAMVVLTLGLSWFLTWLWVVRHAFIRPPELDTGTLLVCGHRLEDGHPSADYRQRLARAAELCRRHRLRVILLGGGEGPSEAQAGQRWLLEHGDIDPDRITLEELSTDSFENLRNARDLTDGSGPVYLLSSRYHLGRLVVLARQLGLTPRPVPAESKFRPSLYNMRMCVCESAFLCWFVSGRLWATLARRRPLLARLQ